MSDLLEKIKLAITELKGKSIPLVICVIGWYFGFYLHNQLNHWQYGQTLELTLVSVLLTYKSIFHRITNVLTWLNSTDIKLCEYKLSSVIRKMIKTIDEHDIYNYILLSLTKGFSDEMLLPLFYYLVTNLSGLILYKTLYLSDSILNGIKTSNKFLILNTYKINGTIPMALCIVLTSISNLITTTKVNNIKISNLYNPPKWSIHFIILRILSWFNIKRVIKNQHSKLSIIDKYYNNNNWSKNIGNIIRAKMILSLFAIILTVVVIIIKEVWFECFESNYRSVTNI
ncbi:cobalamin biosynthesis protein [Candidatus Hodgkinia cicadicola]|uniref:Cobalamin biosynthesis protein n=1 Tax=Candidatus Hodgkinia cicadicola TaxID=573658 RepID=A0ABX4MFV4_9HYPH|nr:cobalamin biosynthesis protein [Candidatus Hodgkinia cicadicola]PIM95550.1 cobalamin biosynthesis protein [Candidatus Hodgkinia cicadicola]